MERLINQIPEDVRREILENNIIGNAKAIESNYEMKYLMIIWVQYIETTIKAECPLCWNRVLKNFKAMEPKMIELEKQRQLLG